MISKKNPVITQQSFIKKPALELYHNLLQPELVPILWGFSVDSPFKGKQWITWINRLTGLKIQSRIKKLVPGKLISMVWQVEDSFTSIDFEFNRLNSRMTLLTFTAYDFTEKGDYLIQAMEDKRLIFKMTLQALNNYLEI